MHDVLMWVFDIVLTAFRYVRNHLFDMSDNPRDRSNL